MSPSTIRVTRIIYNKEGKEIVARVPTEEEKLALREKLLAAGKALAGCECGEEFCDGAWIWRCMADGGGECDWYMTNQVC